MEPREALAILGGIIAVTYRTEEGETVNRTIIPVEPLAVSAAGNEYAKCYDLLRHDFRSFRPDRVLRAVLITKTVVPSSEARTT